MWNLTLSADSVVMGRERLANMFMGKRPTSLYLSNPPSHLTIKHTLLLCHHFAPVFHHPDIWYRNIPSHDLMSQPFYFNYGLLSPDDLLLPVFLVSWASCFAEFLNSQTAPAKEPWKEKGVVRQNKSSEREKKNASEDQGPAEVGLLAELLSKLKGWRRGILWIVSWQPMR